MPSNIAPAGSAQKIAISSTSAQSALINGKIVHITPTVDCFFRAGVTPAASPVSVSDGTDHFLVANATQEFYVEYGTKLAFITTAATGTVYVVVVG